jgi:hypothetical protein
MVCLLFQDFDGAAAPRREEFDACIAANLAHPVVAHAIDLAERGFQNPRFAAHPKLLRHALDHRLTFADAVRCANALLPLDTLVVLVNLDVQLGTGWHDAALLVPPGSRVALCLGRHEFTDGGRSEPDPALAEFAHAHAHDAWVWRTPLEVQDADFPLGTAGCDNAFAHRLAQAGRLCRNPMFQLEILHRDGAGRPGTYSRRDGRSAADRPEARGALLVPAAARDGSCVEAIDKLLRRMDPATQERVAMELYNRFVKIRN